MSSEMVMTRRRQRGGTADKVAGSMLVLVGALNVGFGALSLASDVVRLGTGVAVALAVAGLATLAAGLGVWRGSALVGRVAFTVLALLLLVQLSDLLTGPDDAAAGVARAGVLLVMVASLGVAIVGHRRGGGATCR
jgi:hypothetical protein